MIYTFDALRRQVLRELDEEEDAPSTKVLATDYLNQAHQMRALSYSKFFLLHPKAIYLTTIPGVQRYTLNPLVANILYLRNDTEEILMREIPNRGLSTGSFDWAKEDGTATEFMFWGHSQVKNQPRVPGLLTVRSDNTADGGVIGGTDTTHQVAVKGTNVDGDVFIEIFTLEGTTPIIGHYEFEEVISITKSGEFAGTLTITADEGETTLLTLSPVEMGKQYRQIFLVQIPRVPEVLSYRFFRKPLILINDFDVPELPSPYSQLLVWDALMLFAGYNTDIRPETVAAWRRQQEHWEIALDQYLKDSTTLGAEALFVQDKESTWNDNMPTFGN
jgi:hypothetical protein